MNKFGVVLAACAGVALSMTVGASLASAAGGTISGTVKYDGTAPAPRKVEVTKDKDVCGLHPHFEEDLIVDSGGGIANAVVIVKGAKGDMKPGEVQFDAEGMRLRAARARVPGRQHRGYRQRGRNSAQHPYLFDQESAVQHGSAQVQESNQAKRSISRK